MRERADRVFVELARSRTADGGDLEGALRELAEAAARTLDVERASFWLYCENRSCIRCIELYERRAGRHSQGVELAAAKFPAYFTALEEERTLAAHDAHADPRTQDFSASYLTPLGIGAMLDAPIWTHGEMIGVVCHEHVGPARPWTLEEQSFAASIADLAALAFEAVERHRSARELREKVAELQILMGVLQESEERYRLATEAVAGLVYDWDVRTGRVQRSRGLWPLLGYLPEEVEPTSEWWRRQIHPENLEWVREKINRLVETGSSSFSLEYRVRHRGGHFVYVWENGLAVRDDEGRVVRVVGNTIDISDRKRAEEALVQAKEAAEEANEAKDRFLATLSHELRTPLTPVLAVTSGLERDGRLPDDVRRSLAMVRRNVELEARLIDDLLDLTRITRGKLELHREVADLRDVLDHALQTVAAELEAKRLRLSPELAEVDHRLWADAPRLTQVFWNLLHNAVKFTPAGGAITVRSRREEGAVAVDVSDSGIGIDADVLPRIFDAFEQADRRITRQFGGLGLGLAVSRAIVELHGGTLTAASGGRGQGATFTVRLPVQSGLPPPMPQPEDRPSGTQDPKPLHILLIEDHADTAEAMAELLRDFGHRVTVAGSVAEGLAAAGPPEERERIGIDLVLSDLGLPDGSGLDLMRELKARHGLRGIALSGYGMEEDVRQSHEAGFARHMTKPVNIQALEAAIRQVAGDAGDR